MNRITRRWGLAMLILAAFLSAQAGIVRAQDEAAFPDTTTAPPSERYGAVPAFAGEFTPGRGFDILKTKRGSINVSV
jgi:hypothetical protein